MSGTQPHEGDTLPPSVEAQRGEGILALVYDQRFWVARRHVEIVLVDARTARRTVRVTVDAHHLRHQGEGVLPRWNDDVLLPIATLGEGDEMGTEIFDHDHSVAPRVPEDELDDWLRAFLEVNAEKVLYPLDFPHELREIIRAPEPFPLTKYDMHERCGTVGRRNDLTDMQIAQLRERGERLMAEQFLQAAHTATHQEHLVVVVDDDVLNQRAALTYRYEIYTPIEDRRRFVGEARGAPHRRGTALPGPSRDLAPEQVAGGKSPAEIDASWWEVGTTQAHLGVGPYPSARAGVYDLWAPPETRVVGGGLVSEDGDIPPGSDAAGGRSRAGLFLRTTYSRVDQRRPRGEQIAGLLVHDGGGALLAATYFVAVSLAVVLAGFLLAQQNEDWLLVSEPGGEAAVALLALLPAFAGPVYAARAHAHPVARRIERPVRGALLSQFFGVVPPAAAVALRWEGDIAKWTWLAAWAFLGALLALLLLHYAVIFRRTGRPRWGGATLGAVLVGSAFMSGVVTHMTAHQAWYGPVLVAAIVVVAYALLRSSRREPPRPSTWKIHRSSRAGTYDA